MLLMYSVKRFILWLCDAYSLIIFVYVLMSWIPNHQFGTVGKVYRVLGTLCDPYLNLFKRFIPPIGGYVDISPIVALLVLQLVSRFVVGIL